MQKLAVLMALPIESQGLFEAAHAPIYFCGIGKVNASVWTAKLILDLKYNHILNLGSAGSQKLKTHSLVECVRFAQRDMDLTPLGFAKGETPFDKISKEIQVISQFPNLPQGVCGTGDNFATSGNDTEYDAIDMEAFAMAKTCQLLGAQFHSVKYITDGADHNASDSWEKNLKPASEALFQVYQEFSGLLSVEYTAQP